MRAARVELEEQLRAEIASFPVGEALVEPLEIAPRKPDTGVETFVLAWAPWWVDAQGAALPAWR